MKTLAKAAEEHRPLRLPLWVSNAGAALDMGAEPST